MLPRPGTAVAATAPLGADVLERLAAKHDIAYLLTRPDRPRGRGRRVGPPPAKEVAERLGIEVRQPESVADLDPEGCVVGEFGERAGTDERRVGHGSSASKASVTRSLSSGTVILPISSPKKPRITSRRASVSGMPRAIR